MRFAKVHQWKEGKGALHPNYGWKQRNPAEAKPLKTRFQTDEILLEVGRGQKRKKTKLNEKRIFSQPVPLPLLIHVSPCGGVEKVKEPLGPVDDPVLDPAISQETLSKKVRVGLEYLARVAREWPETASKGENVDEKRRFERSRRRGGRRRSTLIVDLGLQLVSTKTDSLATVDS